MSSSYLKIKFFTGLKDLALQRSRIDGGLTLAIADIRSAEIALYFFPDKMSSATTLPLYGTYVILSFNLGHSVPSDTFTENPSEYLFQGVGTRFANLPYEQLSSFAALATLLYFLISLVL